MKRVIVILLVLMVGIIIFPVFLPKTTHQEAEYIYDADAKQVYDYFNNLKKMSQWFGWSGSDIEPHAKFSTPAEGVGASFKWNRDGGKGGAISITDAKENQFVGYNLSFGETEGNTSEAIFQALDDGKVKVIWTFDTAEVSYPFQIYAFFMRRSIKKNLQQGLEKLNDLLQKEKAKHSNTSAQAVQEVSQSAHKLFGIMQTTNAQDESEYHTALGEAIGMVESYLMDENLVSPTQINGDVVYFLKRDNKENNFVAGFFTEANVPPKEGMQYVEIPAYKCLTITVNNSMKDIKNGYEELQHFAQSHNYYVLQNSWQIIREDKVQIFVPIEK